MTAKWLQKWTIVQHSAFGYKDDARFKHGLELRLVETRAKEQLVQQVGGLLFDTYAEASDFAVTGAYPPGTRGLIPKAPGKFSFKEIDGLRIYIPPKEVSAA